MYFCKLNNQAQRHPYIAPNVTVVSMRCESGYATSDCDHTLLPEAPDGMSDNTASSYERESWEW